MLIDKIFEIDSCDDEELCMARKSKLEYKLTYDNKKDIQAIVFLIPGMGANKDISLLDLNREYIAQAFDVAVVNVFYHCFCNRPSNEKKYNAYTAFLEQDLPYLNKALSSVGIDSNGLNTYNAHKYYNLLISSIKELKKNKKISQDHQALLSAAFVPQNDDYQNYGLMAAIDHINVLKAIINDFPRFSNLPKIYGGGSYGGYLAFLIYKIAPHYVDGIIDNSCSVLPQLRYIIGRDIGEADSFFNDPDVLVKMHTQTYWNRDENSPYYFSRANYMIRTLLNSTHIQIQANIKKPIIISYHSAKDEFNTAKDKKVLFDIYKYLNFDATLHLIKNENQIDGKFIKNLEHGMRINDKALFFKELPLMLKKLQNTRSYTRSNSITYPCLDKNFTFKDINKYKYVLEVK